MRQPISTKYAAHVGQASRCKMQLQLLLPLPAGLPEKLKGRCASSYVMQLLLLSPCPAGLPEKLKAGAAPPKPKVGLLLSLALLLRAFPAVLPLCSTELHKAGRQYTAPARLPVLLWVLGQGGAASPAAAVATWVRVLLPQLLGAELASTTNNKQQPEGKGQAAGQGAPGRTTPNY